MSYKVIEPDQDQEYIKIIDEDDGEIILISQTDALELAHLLMSICKGQGSGRIHTIPKDKAQ